MLFSHHISEAAPAHPPQAQLPTRQRDYDYRLPIAYQATALLPNSLQSGCISKLLPVKVPTAGPH